MVGAVGYYMLKSIRRWKTKFQPYNFRSLYITKGYLVGYPFVI